MLEFISIKLKRRGGLDIVTKVKPAVISVRVKIPVSAELMMLQQNPDDEEQIPVHPGSPLDKFSQQFSDQFGQQFSRQFGPNTPRRHETITGEGSGFFISADGYAVTNNHVVAHAKSVQVTTDDNAAPCPLESAGPPTIAVLPSADSTTEAPCCAAPLASAPTSFVPCWDSWGIRPNYP